MSAINEGSRLLAIVPQDVTSRWLFALIALSTLPLVLLAIYERDQALTRAKHTKGCRRLGLKAGSNLADQFAENVHEAPPDQWRVKSLWIYPVKSCRGVELEEGTIIARGIEYDRQFTFAQLKDSVSSGDGESKRWEFITQRQYPLLATVETEVWIPDPTSEGYDAHVEAIQSGGVIVLRFPWSQSDLYGTLLKWTLAFIGTAPKREFYLPWNPTQAQIQKAGYSYDQIRIWKDTTTALDIGNLVPPELSSYLGIKGRFGLFRTDDTKLREVFRCAPRKEEIGYQPVTGFQDAVRPPDDCT